VNLAERVGICHQPRIAGVVPTVLLRRTLAAYGIG
jgi:hypothetical protein